MGIGSKYVLEKDKPMDWNGVCLARDTTSESWDDFFNQLEYSAKINGKTKYDRDSETVIIDEIAYDIERINILNFCDDVYFFKLVKI